MKILEEALLKIDDITPIFLFMTLCSPVGGYLYFGGIVSHAILRRGAVGCSDTPLTA